MEYNPTYTVVILEETSPYDPIKSKVMKMVKSFWTLYEAKDMQKKIKEKTIIIATY